MEILEAKKLEKLVCMVKHGLKCLCKSNKGIVRIIQSWKRLD